MVLNTQPGDPCVVTPSELKTYEELMWEFEDYKGRKRERRVRGTNGRHEWYTRPVEKGWLRRLMEL